MIEPRGADLGRKVIYTDGQGKREEGRVSGFNREYVFVRYGGDARPKATRRADLEWSEAPDVPGA